MASQEEVTNVLTEAVQGDNTQTDYSKLSLESLVLLINTERLKQLQQQTTEEFSSLKKRQDQVAFLHQLIKAINASTNEKGEFDCSKNTDLQNLLKEAKGMNVDLKEDKFKYNAAERERLIDNVRMTVDDLNVKNDMQLQTITRLTNERYESYQMARSILKPLHDDKLNKARSISK